ncbi:hypothetical protein PF010_g21699 [Phytophthora fragariae]|uniref:Uncharacterized protein n=1 Tax=Phytophthora fragariae TaxID=53985 RepID=A0A6A3IHD8_9STRA|nr:hypothetical protein PF011_g21620 [Phytophthora fragariae]KAE9082157.1 hypothetical protein PF010_g21699 [Phytophthora fragariae]
MNSTSKVHPAELARPNCIAIVHDTLTKVFGGAANYWSSLQVGHRERYSVQRLLSFRDYYERTSPTRVFVVCSASLVPAFALAVVMECVPLKPPEAGWKAYYAFWIRLFVSSLPISFGAAFQVLEVIEPDVISTTGIAVTAVGTCAGYVALTMGIAASWKFPVPFGYVFCVPPFVGLYMVLLVLSIGPRVLARTPVLRRQLFSQLLIVAAQAILAIAYPLFSAVFNQLSGMQQSAFVFVLPVLKFCIKEVIARMASHLEECVGLIVVFSVDVCNVVYVAVCMQTAISPLTSVVMLGSDAFFVMLALRSIYYHAGANHSWRKERLNGGYLDDLMELIREAFRYANKPNAFPVPIRVRAPIELPLSLESARFISDLVHAKRRNAGEAQSLSVVSTRSMSRQEVKQNFNFGNVDIFPKGPGRVHAISSRSLARTNFEEVVRASARPTTVAPSSNSVAIADARDALQTLFHSEYVVMAEFVECAIPILYGVYLTCLYHLPTAAYYPHTRSMTPEKFKSAQLNFMMYAMVEFVSFASLSLLLKRKFGFSPLYQLAFVLETQRGILQGHFFLWVSWILQITLVHNGVDLKAPFK